MSKRNVFKKYRILDNTEIIQKGDQYYNWNTRGWKFVGPGIGKPAEHFSYLRIRRAITPVAVTPVVLPPPAPTPVSDGYYYLRAGDPIKGDEEWDLKSNGNWVADSMWVGQTLRSFNVGKCRRKGPEKPTINPGLGYRLLEKGEVLRVDDEVQQTDTSNWKKTYFPGSKVGGDYRTDFVYRREVEPTLKVATVNPGLGYRLLEKGEILKEGDQAKDPTCDKWDDTVNVGLKVDLDFGTHYAYRRKVEAPKYRFLEPGEVVQPDDEYCQNWNKATFADGIIAVGRTGKFRRLVK